MPAQSKANYNITTHHDYDTEFIDFIKEDDLAEALSFEEFAGDNIVSWKYLRAWRRRRLKFKEKWKDAEELANHIDPVPKSLIAKLKVDEIYNHAPKFAKELIKFALPDESIKRRNMNVQVETNDIKKYEEIKQRRKMPKRKEVWNLFAKAIEQSLVGNDNLFSKDEDLEQEYKIWKEKLDKMNNKENNSNKDSAEENFDPTELEAYVNMFVVDKTTKKEIDGISPALWKFIQRIILDARLTNARLKNSTKMEIFTLEALLQRIGGLFRSADNVSQIFTSQCDLRHFFHQVELPRRYRRFLRINLGNGSYVYPRTWPMGFHMSPGVAQSLTWGMLLRDVECNKEKIQELGIEQSHTKEFDHYVQWLPLKDGGAVFVCIDNIFFITKNGKHHEAWLKHINEAVTKSNAVLKEQSDKGNLFESKIFNWKDRKETSIIFGGIEFFREGRRPKESIEQVEALEKKQYWKGTFRELAAIFGQCLWHYRVKGRKLIELIKFLDFYKFCFPRDKQDWDDQVPATVINDEEFQEALQEFYQEGRNWQVLTPYEEIKPQNSFCLLTTDAALEEKKLENKVGAMWSFLEDETAIHPIDPNYFKNLPEIFVKEEKNRKVYAFSKNHNQPHIALAELEAVADALELIKKQRNGNLPDVIMLAIDSMAAKGMLGRGFSKIQAAREILKRIDSIKGNSKLFLIWVASEDNPSDAPSRNKDPFSEENMELFDKIEEKLINLRTAARTSFIITGKQNVNDKSEKRRQRKEE